MTRTRLSVAVPTLNEAANLERLAADATLRAKDVEVVLADGGSSDRTVEIAQAAGFRTLAVERGRGQQLAAAAEAAEGDVVLFLHADTRLEPGWRAAIDAALKDPAIVGGNFRLLFDGGDEFSHWLNGFYERIRARGVYYGDSAIFCRRSVYDRIGGVRPIALMEDFDFVRRLERSGKTVCIEAPHATTSARRFRGRRKSRIITQWIVIHLLFLIGVSPSRLARLYDSQRRRTES